MPASPRPSARPVPTRLRPVTTRHPFLFLFDSSSHSHCVSGIEETVCVGRCLGGGLLGLGLLLLGSRSLTRLGLGGIGLGGRRLGLGAVRRRPEGEVVAEELHDEGAVAVRLLGKRVKLGNSIVKGLLSEVASTVGRVQDLVVEDGEVEGETEADGVGRRQLRLGDVGGVLRNAGLVKEKKAQVRERHRAKLRGLASRYVIFYVGTEGSEKRRHTL